LEDKREFVLRIWQQTTGKRLMTSNSESIAQRLHGQLDELIKQVSETQSAHRAEERLWQGMLKIGRGLMQLSFTAHSEGEQRQASIEVNGERYSYQRQSTRDYVSLFGEVQVERAYYWNGESGGICPLDGVLSLPERRYSDSVQERMSEISTWVPQDHSLTLLERWLSLKIPKGSLQRSASDQAFYVEDYYQQREAVSMPTQDTILVATADGKGIPMTRQDSPPPQARRSKGSKKTAKKEAIVTALYSVSPYIRDSQDLVHALLPQAFDLPKRPRPSGKQTFGTLDGKTAALTQLAQQVAQRERPQFVYRVALTDGSPALQQQMTDHLPSFTLVLDIIHATEYLWDAANARWGETAPERLPWMVQALTWLVEDHLDDLLTILDTPVPDFTSSQQASFAHVSAYLRRNRPFMDYQRYLALGWPIGTGVVEGACRHLVKDRFEQAGMRWSKVGAQAMLDLRTVAFNDDWLDFQCFRRQQSHRERYHTPYPDSRPDISTLERAA
jgi:hypothetical protein